MRLGDQLTRVVSSRHFSRLGTLCIGLLVVGLCATPIWAQSSTAGTVAGQVTDESGAAVPGAAVKLTENATGAAQTTVSNDAGRYIFSQVNPGTYKITFTKEGLTFPDEDLA